MTDDEKPLRLYSNDVIDTVCARDPFDAAMVMTEWTGEDYDAENSGAFVVVDDDDEAITVQNYPDEGQATTKTAAEWAREHGRGFLCSTEF